MPRKLSDSQMLLVAARDSSVDCVSAWLKLGADPDYPGLYGKTPLMSACDRGKLRSARKLIEWGANVNARDKEKNTVLMHACSEVVNPKVVELLLSRIDGINRKNAYGQTALMLAASSGNAEVVRQLVQHGADVNVVSDQQETPLTFAVVWGHRDVIEVLLQANVDVNWTDEHGWTPLKYALHEKRWEIANLLHDHGAGLAPLTNGASPVQKRERQKMAK
jgi:ankyrin repeat protein